MIDFIVPSSTNVSGDDRHANSEVRSEEHGPRVNIPVEDISRNVGEIEAQIQNTDSGVGVAEVASSEAIQEVALRAQAVEEVEKKEVVALGAEEKKGQALPAEEEKKEEAAPPAAVEEEKNDEGIPAAEEKKEDAAQTTDEQKGEGHNHPDRPASYAAEPHASSIVDEISSCSSYQEAEGGDKREENAREAVSELADPPAPQAGVDAASERESVSEGSERFNFVTDDSSDSSRVQDDHVETRPSDAFDLLSMVGAWRVNRFAEKSLNVLQLLAENPSYWSSKTEVNFINSNGNLSRRTAYGRFSPMNETNGPEEKIVCASQGERVSCSRMSRRKSHHEWDLSWELDLELSSPGRYLVWKRAEKVCQVDFEIEAGGRDVCRTETWIRHVLPRRDFGIKLP